MNGGFGEATGLMGSLKKNILTQLIVRISTFAQLWEHFLQNKTELFRLEKPLESTKPKSYPLIVSPSATSGWVLKITRNGDSSISLGIPPNA